MYEYWTKVAEKAKGTLAVAKDTSTNLAAKVQELVLGTPSSRFRDALRAGNEVLALQIIQSKEFPRDFDPLASYGAAFHENTAFHFACEHACFNIVELFLKSPNLVWRETVNASGQNLLHSLWSVRDRIQLRLRIFGLLRPFIDVNATDNDQDTILHQACRFGIKELVLALLAQGAKVNVLNAANQNPADEAQSAGYHDLAALTEAKLVYGNWLEPVDNSATALELDHGDDAILHLGMKMQELRAQKDGMLVLVSEALGVSLFAAEALLRSRKWQKEALLDAWFVNEEAVCKEAGIVRQDAKSAAAVTCLICQDDVVEGGVPLINMACGHSACRDCWKGYLDTKIAEGDTDKITCFAPKCGISVPLSLIEELVDAKMAARYLMFDLRQFVEADPQNKWCPFPSCKNALHREKEDVKVPEQTATTTADCGEGHFFCINCNAEPHDPCSCEDWKDWKAKILPFDGANGNEAADALWLTANTKKCPSCETPIQKNEGCNHMTCSKCKHGFCWICMEAWSLHGQRTGGYFQCNRYKGPAASKANDSEREAKAKEKETEYLLHYYTRYKVHEQSKGLERTLMSSAAERMTDLQVASESRVEVGFLEHAFRELLLGRTVLCASYVYLYKHGKEPNEEGPSELEYLQSHLERATEALSSLVARKRLHGTRTEIMSASLATRKARVGFLQQCVTLKTEESSAKPQKRGFGSLRSLLGMFSSEPKRTRSARQPREPREHSQLSRSSRRSSRISSSRHSNSEMFDALNDMFSQAIVEESDINSLSSPSSREFSSPPPPFTPSAVSSPVVEVEEKAGSHGGWQCAVCTLRNVESATACIVCSTGRSESSLNAAQQELLTLRSITSVPPVEGERTWACSQCTYVNDQSHVLCAVCDAPSPTIFDHQ